MSPAGSAVTNLKCHSCGSEFDLDHTTFPCPDCGGILDPQYDYDSIESREKTSSVGTGRCGSTANSFRFATTPSSRWAKVPRR